MRTRLAIKTHALLEKHFPERRVFLKSDSDTRFIRLRPATQLAAYAGASLLVAWAIVATAILLMDSIGSGNFREQAKRDQHTYQDRLNALSIERDARAEEALAAQNRFNAALAQISVMQSELLASENRRRELETGIEVIQSTLRDTMREREAARTALAALREQTDETGPVLAAAATAPVSMDLMAGALERTAQERDRVVADAREALKQRDDLEFEIKLMHEQNDQIFRQLEDAVTVSLEPLDKMFQASGMSTSEILDTVKRGYSGQGGPLMPLVMSTKDSEIDADTARANEILDALDRMNIYRIAAEKLPFGMPVKNSFRYTSGFGMRWGRLHAGTDMAGPVGTPIYASADGVVVEAGWVSGYGRLIKIKHDFGVETRYGHLSAIKVSKGQRVSRGERIGDMGNSGRSTGPHLHYEIRVGGNPIDPMIYIKAARNVF